MFVILALESWRGKKTHIYTHTHTHKGGRGKQGAVEK